MRAVGKRTEFENVSNPLLRYCRPAFHAMLQILAESRAGDMGPLPQKVRSGFWCRFMAKPERRQVTGTQPRDFALREAASAGKAGQQGVRESSPRDSSATQDDGRLCLSDFIQEEASYCS